jgi:hypothetical protein
MSGRFIELPIIFTFIAVFFTILHFIYIIYININKFIYMRKVLKSDKFDIKNSPLDRMARLFARVIYCGKVGCDNASTFGVGIGIMLGIDQILENGNKPLLFRPYLNQGLNKFIPSAQSNILYHLAKAKENRNDSSLVSSVLEEINKDGVTAGLSQQDIQDINNVLNEDISILDKNHDKIKKDIDKELENLSKNIKDKDNDK